MKNRYETSGQGEAGHEAGGTGEAAWRGADMREEAWRGAGAREESGRGADECDIEELVPVVAQLAQKYAGSDSSSVSYETAQMLMGAAQYCVNEYAQFGTDSLSCRNLSAAERYRIGKDLVLKKAGRIRELFNEMSASFEDYGIRCLRETVLDGIPGFLKRYDPVFCPQNTILTLDYPVLADLGRLCGADRIYAYLWAIRAEQAFLSGLDKNYVVSVLERHDPEYRDMTDNACSVALASAVGHMALRKPFGEDGFSREDYARLTELFAGKDAAEIEAVARQFIFILTSRFYGNDGELAKYLCLDARNLAARTVLAAKYGQLGKIFVW